MKKEVKFMISEELLREFDLVATLKQLNKSELIQELMMKWIEKIERRDNKKDYKEVK